MGPFQGVCRSTGVSNGIHPGPAVKRAPAVQTSSSNLFQLIVFRQAFREGGPTRDISISGLGESKGSPDLEISFMSFGILESRSERPARTPARAALRYAFAPCHLLWLSRDRGVLV